MLFLQRVGSECIMNNNLLRKQNEKKEKIILYIVKI